METINTSQLFVIEGVETICAEAIKKNSQFHLHNYYSAYWIRQGEVVHATNYVEYTVPEQALLFVPSNLVHRMIIAPGSESIGIFFNQTFFAARDSAALSILSSALFVNPDFRTTVTLSNEQNQQFAKLINMMRSEWHTESDEKNDIVFHLLKVFLLKAIQLHKQQYEPPRELCPENPVGIMVTFKQLLEDNYQYTKEVSFYADKLNVRPTLLNDVAKKTTGITAGELIRNRVLEEAKKMLYATDKPAKEIAYQLGFTDPAYFSRFFKKYTQTTTANYRNQIRKKYN